MLGEIKESLNFPKVVQEGIEAVGNSGIFLFLKCVTYNPQLYLYSFTS